MTTAVETVCHGTLVKYCYALSYIMSLAGRS